MDYWHSKFTGAAESITRAIVNVSKGKYAAPIIMCITGILTFGGVSGFVGFGGAVQNISGFSDLVSMLKNLQMPPLVFVMITVAVCAGACGSASGGMGIVFNALKNTYMEMGINFQSVHRISAIAAGTQGTLPHQGAQITLFGICKMTHKEAYWDIAVIHIIIPFIACGIFIILASFGL